MRALVFGAYPPMPGPQAAATLATVRALLAQGLEVEVFSPSPSAAHRHGDLGRTGGVVRLARRAAGAEVVALHLEARWLLGPGAGRQLPLARLALGLALRRAGRVSVHLGPIGGPLDAKAARLVLGSAGQVWAASVSDREALVAAGLSPGRVEVAEAAPSRPEPGYGVSPGSPVGEGAAATTRGPAGAPGGAGVSTGGEACEASASTASVSGTPSAEGEGDDGPGPWRLEPEPAREELQAEVARRATWRRGAAAAASPDGAQHLPGTPASRPLLALPPLAPAPARSPKPGVGLIKRVVARLVGWQVDPVVEQVNRLQRAVLEALEALEAQPAETEGPDEGTASSR